MILEPPAIYDFPYVGPQTEMVRPAPEIDRICRSFGARSPFQILGCNFSIGEVCHKYLAKHVERAARRHEDAHCHCKCEWHPGR